MEEIEKGAHISGPVLQEKALQLNGLLQGENNFAASNGWLDRWKKRHGIRLHSMTADRSADQADKHNLWADTTGFLTSYLCSAFETGDELKQQDSCTPDFQPSLACFGERNHTFPGRKKRKHPQPDREDEWRERFKKQLVAAVKRFRVAEPNSGEDKFADVPVEILHLVKEVPRDCVAEDASGWVTADLESADESETAVAFGSDVTDESPVTNIAATRAMEVAVRYIRQHADATPSDVRFMERWRNIAASSLLSNKRKKELD